ncbi:carbohydrate ABC transporter permease [Nocardioides lijunqiniae]|uniref:carbohydrate ABC transporter permease n=1 Tax=Nocardioides lijunqiniae TaxID=2760832 RepID=UPI0018780CF3|nr:sugar ABC transporter permease [Nocardioides lijunqiniae]
MHSTALTATPVDAPTEPAEGGRPVARPARRRTPRGALPYALVLPALAALCVGLGYPLARQLVLSFQDYGLAQQFGQPAPWVGLDNYRALVDDTYLWSLVLRSVLFCFFCAGVTMAVGVGIALLLRLMSRTLRLLVQTALLLAWAMPVLAVLTVWQWLFDSQYGVINWTLTRLGGDFAGHPWLLEPLSFFLVAAIVVVWMSVPFVAFTVYAGLTQVPEELLEAAEVDGADARSRLRHIILPVIRPVLLVVGLLQVIWDLRVFTQIYVLQKAGGVTADTNLLGTYIYRSGIGEGRFGTAAAVAVFMLVLTIVLTSPYVVRMLREEES